MGTPQHPATLAPPGALPAALRHALSAYPEDVAARAETLVRTLCPERLADPSAAAWSGSPLTGDGFPAEVAFSTTDDRLRLTVEPGAHDLDPGRRLALAADRVGEAGGRPVPPEIRQELRSLQGCGPLRYGAWVSCRAGPEGSGVKLYAEVSDPRMRWPAHAAPVLDDRDVALRMVAHNPATGETESYLRIPSLLPGHLPAVLAPAGAEHAARLLVDWVEALYGHRVRGRLPGPSVGVSYTSGAASNRVTLHFTARALWGGDGRIRDRFAEAAAGLGGDPSSYLAVTAPLAGTSGWRTRHGIVGLTLEAGMPASLTVGVRPVAPDPLDEGDRRVPDR
jgi:hypothetical protein